MGKLEQLLRRWSDTPEARLLRPPLPPIEPELLAPCPRLRVWVTPKGTPPWLEHLLRNGRATRAWVYSHAAWKESDGPEVRVRYAFEAEDGSLVFGHYSGSFDGYHLAMNADFSRFIETAMRPRGTFTVLHPPDRPWEHHIYGVLEARLFIPVVELGRRLAASGEQTPHQRQSLRGELAAAFESLPQLEYYAVTSRFLDAQARPKGYHDHARLALDAVEAGRASTAALEHLQRVQRGRWTAT